MALTFTIDGQDRTTKVVGASERRTLSLSMGLHAPWEAEFDTYDVTTPATTAYRPALDESVVIEWDTDRVFDGKITRVENRPWAAAAGAKTRVRAKASVILDQIKVTQTYDAGKTLKEIVTHLFDFYINPYFSGPRLDESMGDGPTLGALTFDGVTLREVWARLMELTGFIIRLTPENVIECFEVGDKTAPFSLDKTNVLGPVVWERSRSSKVNTAELLYGAAAVVDKTDTFTGDGTTTNFPLTYSPATLPSYLTLDGVFVGINTTWTITDGEIVFDSAPGNGAAISITYPVQFPQKVTAEDATDVINNGPWYQRFEKPDVFDKAEAQAWVNALLRLHVEESYTVRVVTRAGFALPGDVVPLSFEDQGLPEGDYLITHVRAVDVLAGSLQLELTCVSGVEAKPSRADKLLGQLSGSFQGSGAVLVTGTLTPGPSGRFVSEVVSYAGLADVAQHQSRLGTHANATAAGPALVLGRDDSDYAWAIVADMTDTIRGLYFIPFQESGTYRYAMRLTQGPSPADAVYYLTPNGNVNGQIFLGAPSTLFGPGHRITGGYFTALDVTDGITERGLSVKMGEWSDGTATFGSSAGTWTVEAGDITTLRWTRIGKTIVVAFVLVNTALSGSAAQTLTIAIPGGLTAQNRMDNPLASATDSAGVADAFAYVVAGQQTINIEKRSGTWPTGAITLAGQITIEVQ